MEQKVTRRKLKAAIDSGLTPEELAAEVGVSVRKLYTAIRGLYKYAAYAEGLIEQLKLNRKKPIQEEKPKVRRIPADKPATIPAAETPALDITKLPNGASENPTSVSFKIVKKPPVFDEFDKVFKYAADKGCIVDTTHILDTDMFSRVKGLPSDKVFVPACVLNTIRVLVEYGRASKDDLEKVAWLEENVTILERAPKEIWIEVPDKAYKDKTLVMAKHALNVMVNYGYPDAILLTFSSELRQLMRQLKKGQL